VKQVAEVVDSKKLQKSVTSLPNETNDETPRQKIE